MIRPTKVLISGMTGANVYGQLRRTQVYTQSHMYREGLEHLKYDVVNQAPNEDELMNQVNDHDSFLIGLAPVGSITAGWRIPCLALIGQIVISGKKLITFVDDWQFQGIYPSLQALTTEDRLKRMAIRDVNMGRLSPDFFDSWKSEIEIGLNYILSKEHTMLSSIMDFGNSNDEFYGLSDNPVFLDPSCYQPIPEYKPEIKFKQWVIAGLQDYSKYWASLGCSWPVHQVGNTVDGKFKSQKEIEVFNAYAKSKGILIPTYKSSHTNWWRPRYLFARHFKCVIYSAPGTTGDHKIFNCNIARIEGSSSYEVSQLIEAQKEKLDEIVWSKERFLNVLGKTMGANIVGGV